MNIVLVGIQGSGKGTMARLIKGKYGYSLFEMGQKLRNFTLLDLPESNTVKELINAGKMVSNELIAKMISHYIQDHKDDFIVFDGIPRSVEQIDFFDLIIGDYCIFFLDLDKETAIKRLAGRRIDPETGESFPADFSGDTNPETGNKLVTRDDDKPEAVSKRIDTFYSNTLPLLAYWASKGRIIYKINASCEIEKEFEQIKDIIENEFYNVNG